MFKSFQPQHKRFSVRLHICKARFSHENAGTLLQITLALILGDALPKNKKSDVFSAITLNHYAQCNSLLSKSE